ncbi:MAG TPA: FixG Ig-like domain-containing protein, partial [Candidatus Competibacteraceae bacterium]|nr:FixG Ig-like domain-containing protein [Candidatus Competibacteraceae bacterium]
IDIRNGLQYQCISCALCIDACDAIMDNMKWPRGLIAYTSENALNGRKTTLLKPKTIGYGVILTAATGILIWSVLTSAPYTAMVEQIRQPLYTRLSDGGIRNSYEVKLNNKLTVPMTVAVRIEGLPGATLDMDGMERLELAPQQRIKLLARVQLPPRQDDDHEGRERREHDGEREKVNFIIEVLEGAKTAPIQRQVPFYLPEGD